MPVSYAEAMRLKKALNLPTAQLTLLVTLIDHAGRCPRDLLRDTVGGEAESFDVHLCGLNRRLPPTIRVNPIYADGTTERYGHGRKRGATGAISYALNSNWGRQELLRLARGEAFTANMEAARA